MPSTSEMASVVISAFGKGKDIWMQGMSASDVGFTKYIALSLACIVVTERRGSFEFSFFDVFVQCSKKC